MDSVDKIINFITEIEQLKGVLRKSKPVGLNRYENSAEHSWHISLIALLFRDYANQPVDIDRVIKMLLIHDLGEIDTGDTIVYAGETEESKLAEENAMIRILGVLPDNLANELFILWQEFTEGVTADAIYARAIDRVPPVLQNLYGNGHSWKENNISFAQIYAVNSRIGKGSELLWENLKQKLSDVETHGFTTKPD